MHSFALVGFHHFSTRLALHVTATDILAIASFKNLFRFRGVPSTATEILAAFVSCAATIAMSETKKQGNKKLNTSCVVINVITLIPQWLTDDKISFV